MKNKNSNEDGKKGKRKIGNGVGEFNINNLVASVVGGGNKKSKKG